MDSTSNFRFFDYLGDNAGEIERWSREVSLVTAGALTQLQRLPVTLRRRAASHNVRRLPFRLRKSAVVSIAKKVVKKCRKFRRRHINIRDIFAKRQSKNKWLCTHIWHAKRFHLENKWGWRVPMTPNQKTFRPCTKAMTNGSSIVDISYYDSYELSATTDNIIIQGLQTIVDSTKFEKIKESLLVGREVNCVLYEPSKYPYGAICPAKLVLFGDATKTSMLLTSHPSVSTQVVSAISTSFILHCNDNKSWSNDSGDIVLVDCGGDCCRFRLIGADSNVIITSMFKDSPEVQNMAKWPLTQVTPGYTLEVLINDPESSRPRLKQTDIKLTDARPLRRRDKLPDVKRGSSYFQMNDSMRREATLYCNKQFEAVKEGEKCPVRLSRHSFSGKTPGGWDVVTSTKWAMKVWTTLIMKGCRPMGLKYWSRYCAVEETSLVAKNDCFPMMCWPDTIQGVVESEESAVKQLSAWKRRPPGKRVNFKLQHTLLPFSCDYKALMPDKEHSFFVMRDIVKLSRVVDPFLDGKVQASSNQLDSWDSDARYSLIPVIINCPKRRAYNYAVIMSSVAGDKKDTLIEQENRDDSVMVRPVIGYVEIADQSMLLGKGCGFGFVSFYRIIECSNDRSATNLFWIKNPNDRRLSPITLTTSK